MDEVKVWVHATVQDMTNRGILIQHQVPTDDRLMEIIKTYDVNNDGMIQKEEMKEFIVNTITIGWVPR